MFDVCPLCEKGVLVETQEDGLLLSVCTVCESEVTNAEQMKKNKEHFACNSVWDIDDE